MSLKKAGKEILKANFGNAIGEIINPNSYRGNNSLPAKNNIPYEISSINDTGVGNWFSWENINSSLIAYDLCPPLQAICNRRALAFANGKLVIKNKYGEVVDDKKTEKFLKLFKNPNKFDTESSFKTKISINIDLVGYAVIIPLRPVGFGIEDSQSLWVVPPGLCTINRDTNQFNFENGGIKSISIGGVEIHPDQLIILTGFDASLHNMFIPSKKIKVLENNINNIIGAYESEANLIKHRGPKVILSGEMNNTLGAPIPITPDEKASIQASFNNSYGFLNGQSNTILTNAVLKVNEIGFDAKQLGLNDTIVSNIKVLADTIGCPVNLFGIVDSKYDNLEVAEKSLYTKFIIPQSINIAEQLTSYFFTKEGYTICYDFKHVPELQADKSKEYSAKKTLMEALKLQFDLDIITYNQMLVEVDLEPIGPEGDFRKSQIKPGNVPLAVILGVGGVQALTEVLANNNIGEGARQSTLEIVFGLSPENARRMSVSSNISQSQTNSNG